jgi:hypothetical protein
MFKTRSKAALRDKRTLGRQAMVYKNAAVREPIEAKNLWKTMHKEVENVANLILASARSKAGLQMETMSLDSDVNMDDTGVATIPPAPVRKPAGAVTGGSGQGRLAVASGSGQGQTAVANGSEQGGPADSASAVNKSVSNFTRQSYIR